MLFGSTTDLSNCSVTSFCLFSGSIETDLLRSGSLKKDAASSEVIKYGNLKNICAIGTFWMSCLLRYVYISLLLIFHG